MKLCLTCQRCYEDTYTSCAHEDHALLVPSRPGPRLIAGKYRLDRLLGRSPMGTVYIGSQLEQKRSAIIKLLQPESLTDLQGMQHFRREAQVIALLNTRLHHSNVADTYDYGTLPEGGAYVAMELIEGYSLGQYMASSGPQLPLPAAVTVARQVADGVEAAHRVGIVHRDLKPSNIILVHDEHDDRLQVKVVDFGISKLKQMLSAETELLDSAESLIDATRYMSPEQCAGHDLDARSDIYSLGVILYEMLAGRPPFDGETAQEIARQHIEQTPRLLTEWRADVPDALAQLVMQALNKKPIIRPQTAAEFARRLRYIDYLSMALPSSVTAPREFATPEREQALEAHAGAMTASASRASVEYNAAAESNVMLPEGNGEQSPTAASQVVSEIMPEIANEIVTGHGLSPDSNVKISRGVMLISDTAVSAPQPSPALDASVEVSESSPTFDQPYPRLRSSEREEALMPPDDSVTPTEPASSPVTQPHTQHADAAFTADHAFVYSSPLATDEVEDDTTTEITPQTLLRASTPISPDVEADESAPSEFATHYHPVEVGDTAQGANGFARRPLYAGLLALALMLLGVMAWMGLRHAPLSDVAQQVDSISSEASAPPQSQGASPADQSPQQSVGQPGDGDATRTAENNAAPSTGSATSASTDFSAAGAENESRADVPGSASAATESTAAPANRTATPAAARTALRSELNKWLAATNSRNIDKQMAFYQPKVDTFYSSRNFSRDAVRAHKARVFAQADAINMRAGEPQITLSDDGRTATMRFRKRFTIKGRQSNRGELVQELQWVKTDAGWKIASERNISERLLNERRETEPRTNERRTNSRDRNAKSTVLRRRDDEPNTRNRRS